MVDFISANSRFRVRFNEDQVDSLISYSAQGWPDETGGILIGRYTSDLSTALITEVKPPPSDSKGGRNWFFRGIKSLNGYLSRLWKKYVPEYYLGEWHTHPGGPGRPSVGDINEMTRIAQSNAVNCPEPILILSHGGRPAWNIAAYVFPRNRPFVPLNSETDPESRRDRATHSLAGQEIGYDTLSEEHS